MLVELLLRVRELVMHANAQARVHFGAALWENPRVTTRSYFLVQVNLAVFRVLSFLIELSYFSGTSVEDVVRKFNWEYYNCWSPQQITIGILNLADVKRKWLSKQLGYYLLSFP